MGKKVINKVKIKIHNKGQLNNALGNAHIEAKQTNSNESEQDVSKIRKIAQWGTRRKRIISVAILLIFVLAIILMINLYKQAGNGSNQEFAEKFCEKVKIILLGSGEEPIKEVKTMLEELKEECKKDSDEGRYIYTLSKCGLLCCQLGYIYEASVFTEDALMYAKELVVSEENYKFIGFCYLNRAGVLEEQNQYLAAEECYLNALHLYEQQGVSYDSDLAVLCTDVANFYYETSDYVEALIYQEKAIEIWKYFGRTNSIDMGVAHIMMARICKYADQKREFSELMSAKNILENNKPESNEYLMILYASLGDYYWSTDKIKAEDYLNQARELGLQLQGELGEHTISAEINLAYVYSEYGQLQKALEILESVVIKCEKIYGENGIGSAYAYAELAAVYGELQQYVKSIDYYGKAQTIYENV